MTAPSDDLSDLQSDIGNLHQLLEVLYDQTGEQEFQRDGKRIALADQIHALAMIARDLAERLNESVDACHTKVLADAKARKAA
ncbi:hypothetical protein [Mesorhizobium sp.]|uniref:hypothetical protein n=1 Tax=Mesorhizobium sp. TaxID=1871066 RepID=UPI000FE5C461|nr:hypothetical protein [Mesorhizobium sp.]RWK66094.1 MAG: hypothetical protein EOR49_03270 [Mesorhizobium sp.]RWM45052.1 MAG: hypothetical protein EOR76_22070 [Mesorhizobium sp.]RWM53195.1 MAG: hypothetical protein EOR78_20190 [Mesorhizobium sp.]RWM62484.1 MAG: hypothetical protein EOR79_02855 [Mesorhizobium sp.]RWN00169.1 MAG: hypothetical protein EOR85_16565 [Mesorhizobium sp.]